MLHCLPISIALSLQALIYRTIIEWLSPEVLEGGEKIFIRCLICICSIKYKVRVMVRVINITKIHSLSYILADCNRCIGFRLAHGWFNSPFFRCGFPPEHSYVQFSFALRKYDCLYCRGFLLILILAFLPLCSQGIDSIPLLRLF